MMERLSLERAIEEIQKQVRPIEETMELTLEQAAGYVLAKDVVARISQPPFSRSPLDGYALRAEDTRGARKDTPVTLRVIDKIMAGAASHQRVERGTAVRLMTGAPIPAGADCVIRQEDTDYNEEKVQIFTALRSHDNVCDAGEDFEEGQVLLKKGDRMDSSVIGLAASAGVTTVTVYRRPRAAVFTSGDELMEPGEALKEGKIYNSALPFVRTRLKEWKVDVVESGRIPDIPNAMERAIDQAADQVDFILTTGGVSVGQKDIMHDVEKNLNAKHILWGVAIKPGAPTLVFQYKGTPVICLTGNPYGTFVNLELLAGPVISYLSRDVSILPKKAEAVADNDFRRRGGVRRIVKARFQNGAVTIPGEKQRSGILCGLEETNCLADIPAEKNGVCRGERVTVWLSDRR